MHSRLKIFFTTLIIILLSLTGLRGQDTIGFYRFENTLAAETGFPHTNSLTATPNSYWSSQGYNSSGAFQFLFGNIELETSLSTNLFDSVRVSAFVKNSSASARSIGLFYNNGTSDVQFGTFNIPVGSNYTSFSTSLPSILWDTTAFTLKIKKMDGSYWGNVFFDDLLISGRYIEFTIDTIFPFSGPPGTIITLKGSGFNSISNLEYDGLSPVYTVLNDSTLQLTIPQNATNSAPITLYGTGTFNSEQIFQLTQINGSCLSGTNLIISELCDPTQYSTTDRYIEIFNPTPDVINLAGYQVNAVTNIATSTEDKLTWTLSGTILPGEAKTCGYTNPIAGGPHDFQDPNWISQSLNVYNNWNGQSRDGASIIFQGSKVVDSLYHPNPSGNIYIFADGVLQRNDTICSPSDTAGMSQWTFLSGTGGNTTAGIYPSTPRQHTVTCQTSPFTWNAHPQNDSICSGQDLQFSININGSGQTLSYQWYMHSPGDLNWTALSNGGNISGATGTTLNISQAGSSYDGAQFYCEVTANAISCGVSSRAAQAVILPAPTPTISNDTTICEGDTASLLAGGGQTYLWSTGDPNASITVNPASTSSYEVTVSDQQGCSATDQVTVTVNPKPVISITPDTSVCQGEQIKLGVSAPNSISYSWSTGSAADSILIGSADSSYTVTVTDGNGCKADSSVQVSEWDLPNVSMSFPMFVSFCIGDTVELIGQNAETYIWNGSIPGDTFQMEITALSIVSVEGTDVNGCTNTNTIQLPNVYPLPVLNISASQSSICLGESTNLSVSGASSYQWNQSLGSGSNKTVSPTTTTTYTVTGTSSQGCVSDSSITIDVKALPNASIQASPSQICIGESSTLQAGGGVSYDWGQGPNANNQNIVTPTATQAYTVTVSGANGCSKDTNITVTVDSVPNIQLTASAASICEGDTSLITASGGASYTWNTTASGSSILAFPLSNTTYSVTGTDGNGCSASDQIAIQVNPLPVLSASATPDTICEGDNVNLSVSGADTYFWENGMGIGIGTGSNQTISPTASTSYVVTGTDTNGCVSTDVVSVSVNPTPSLSLTATQDTICTGDQTTIDVNGADTYSWSHAPGSLTSLTVNPTSTTTYSVTGTDATGCSATESITITVNPLPNLLTSASKDTICQGDSTTLSVSGATSYTWDQSLGSGNMHSVSPSTTTTYSVIGTNASGCSATDMLTITVNTLPAVQAQLANDTLCAGESTILSASGASTYTWDHGLGSGNNLQVSPGSTQIYSVTGTDNNTCSASTSIIIHVNPLPVVVSATTINPICEGNSTDLSASGALNYSWNQGLGSGTTHTVNPLSSITYTVTGTDVNGCTDTDAITIIVDPVPVVTASSNIAAICDGNSANLSATGANTYSWDQGLGSGNSFTVTPSATTTYSVTGTNTQGCTAADAVTVTVNALPSVIISPSQNNLCQGENTTLTASGAGTYLWDQGLGSGSQHTVSPLFSTPYTVTGTDINGCSNTSQITITVNPLPPVAITASSSSICPGDSATIQAIGAQTYIWDQGLTAGNLHTVSPGSATTYSVTGTDQNSCENTAGITINVFPEPQLSISTPPVYCIDDIPFAMQLVSPMGGTYSGPGISNNTFDPATAGNGVHSILYEYADVNTCEADTTFNIEVELLWRLEGDVYYDNDLSKPMADSSRMRISGAALLDSMNLQGGAFSFRCLDNGQYVLQPGTDYSWGGINSTDALLAAKYSIGQVSLSPLRLLAADVNQSGFVNAGDALLILRRFVGYTTSFTSPDWILPFQTQNINGYSYSMMQFGVICAGDIDGSYDLSGSKQGNAMEVGTQYSAMAKTEGEISTLPLFLSSTEEVSAISLILNIQGEGKLLDIEGLPSACLWKQSGSELRLAWYSMDGALNKGENLFGKLIWQGEKTPQLSIQPGSSLGDAEGKAIKEFNLSLGTPLMSRQKSHIWPNPNNGQFSVLMPGKKKESESRWTIMGLSGSVLYEGRSSAEQVQLQFGELSAGIYVLRLIWEDGEGIQEDHHRIVVTE